MAYVKGNSLWEQRAKHGREKTFKTPDAFRECINAYFQWVEENPFKEEKLFGSGFNGSVDKIRPFTINGFCVYAGVSFSWYRNFKIEQEKVAKDNPTANGFLTVCEDLEQICYTQKFDAAAAGFLNANIIARDLGLVDKKEVENKGGIVITVTEEDAQLGKDPDFIEPDDNDKNSIIPLNL